MKLYSIQFNGHPAYSHKPILSIEKFGKITAFVGANSSGKTTTLNLLNEALSFLQLNDFSAKRQTDSEWIFESITIRFVAAPGERLKLPSLAERVGGEILFLEIEIAENDNEFIIKRIESSNGSISINETEKYKENAEVSELSKKITSLKESIKTWESQKHQLSRTPQNRHLQTQRAANIENQINGANNEIRQIQSSLPELSREILNFHDSKTGLEATVQKKDLKIFLKAAGIPTIKHIPFGKMPSEAITNLVNRALESKVSRDESLYQKSKAELSSLLQSEISFWGTLGGENKQISVNGTDFAHLSHGAQVCLLYYAFTFDTSENTIILWDEPENGLHHSRRFKLLELLLSDKRQYIIGTHAPELCPILDSAAEVYQCTSSYNATDDCVELDIKQATSRRSAFEILEALGVNPATTLFTSNIVIWVEGPSDILFWRYWLKKKDIEKKLVEGFDFTFMFYGGSNIANLDFEDTEVEYIGADILSLCRHPVVFVDSDLDSLPEPGKTFSDYLKPGAKAAKEQIDNLNLARPDASVFFVLEAREIENYLPSKAVQHAIKTLACITNEAWSSKSLDSFEVERFSHYQKSIKETFDLKKISTQKDGKTSYPGISKWGRKVDFMKAALTIPSLEVSDLNSYSKQQLDTLYTWITSKKESK